MRVGSASNLTTNKMVAFTKIPNLNLSRNGDVTDSEGYRVMAQGEPADIGIPQQEFEKQVIDLANQGVGIDKIESAIDQHPDIINKVIAKSMATAILKIVSSSKYE